MSIQSEIARAANKAYPNEMCGVITTDGKFVVCNNISPTPESAFTINPIDLVPLVGKIAKIVHSHCIKENTCYKEDVRTPSWEDVKMQHKLGVPFLIVSTDGRDCSKALEYPKAFKNDYSGRPFIWYVNDCYSLVRDYYFYEIGVTLPKHRIDIPLRTSNDISKVDFILPCLKDYGFIETKDIKTFNDGDLLLLNGRLGLKNHLGIFHKGKVLHQVAMSVEVPFLTFRGRINSRLVYVS